MGWRTDWLYQLIFAHLEEIWARIHKELASSGDAERRGPAPEFFRVQYFGDVERGSGFYQTPIVREWLYDGTEFTEQMLDQKIKRERSELHGTFYSAGTVQFSISQDRKRVGIVYVLGPLNGRSYGLIVQCQGRSGKLLPDSNSVGWIS